MSGLTIGAPAVEMEAFGLKHASKQLADQLEAADANGLTCRDFLERLLDCELRGAQRAKAQAQLRGRPLPAAPQAAGRVRPLRAGGRHHAPQVAQLRELTWLDAHGNVVLAGPPGLGKTMVAVGLGLLAIDEGYTVAFEKRESLVRVMDDAEVDRKAGFRMRYLRKRQMLSNVKRMIMRSSGRRRSPARLPAARNFA